MKRRKHSAASIRLPAHDDVTLCCVLQEKFVKDNFLKMDIFEQDSSNSALNHRSSISAKFLTRGQQMQLKQ